MELIEGHEYVTIKPHNIVIIDNTPIEWVPNDARSEHGAIIKDKIVEGVVVEKSRSTKYLETLLIVNATKPYFERRRIMVSGIFSDELMLAGYREIWTWLDDLLFYTYMEGMVVPNIVPAIQKSKKNKLSTLEESYGLLCPGEVIHDIAECMIDTSRDHGYYDY